MLKKSLKTEIVARSVTLFVICKEEEKRETTEFLWETRYK
jgi:hypothetical protein